MCIDLHRFAAIYLWLIRWYAGMGVELWHLAPAAWVATNYINIWNQFRGRKFGCNSASSAVELLLGIALRRDLKSLVLKMQRVNILPLSATLLFIVIYHSDLKFLKSPLFLNHSKSSNKSFRLVHHAGTRWLGRNILEESKWITGNSFYWSKSCGSLVRPQPTHECSLGCLGWSR